MVFPVISISPHSARIVATLFGVLFFFSLTSCKPSHLDRPYGYLRLGPVKDFLSPETFVADDRLLVRHDEGGFSVMSTLCTFDLSPLFEKTTTSGERIWISKFNKSTYAHDGHVLTGPAVKDLPYYYLRLESAKVNGPKDTLYVEIGDEKDKDWRLRIQAPQ